MILKEKQEIKFKLFKAIVILVLFNTVTCFVSFANTHPVDSEVKIRRNLRYGNKPSNIGRDTSSDRTLDLYIPVKYAEKKLPVLIFIHGGGFSGGDKMTKSNELLCEKISAKGYAVVSINYYLHLKHNKTSGASASENMKDGLPEGGKFHQVLQQAVESASADTQLALKWIKEHAKEYNLDKSAVAISGGSAGAMTALHVAYISNQNILPLKSVINFWGGLPNPDLIKKDAIPMLTYHGDQDKLIHVNYALALEKRMKDIGSSQSETHILKDKGHAIYSHITSTKIEEIVAFLKKTL